MSPDVSNSPAISTSRLAARLIVWFIIIFASLFGGAGTISWPEGWIFFVLICCVSVYMIAWLKINDPELLRRRIEFRKRAKTWWDKVFLVIFLGGTAPFYSLPGLDVVRDRWSRMPLPLEVLGFFLLVLSYGLILWVLKTNPFSSAVVEIQSDRGQRVITTGPYRYVRHPMYAGAILGFFAVPLALGSVYTLIPAAVLTATVSVRAYLEDKVLHRELEGYPAYAEEVRYRLIPESGRFFAGALESRMERADPNGTAFRTNKIWKPREID